MRSLWRLFCAFTKSLPVLTKAARTLASLRTWILVGMNGASPGQIGTISPSPKRSPLPKENKLPKHLETCPVSQELPHLDLLPARSLALMHKWVPLQHSV